MCPVHLENVGHKRLFLLLCWVNPALLDQTQKFSFRTVAVQEEGYFEASGEFQSSP
ncbi:hypothetical protein MTR_8g445130 [Medicago truncatula]|uniref:Uncharacterized protein n=1 Tax=Medicago truncatula TaxID=3880 RepID=A0A072TP87_MEDTR|nr:hypothetical protein MTR_8g445130 [Medicago truncatula]